MVSIASGVPGIEVAHYWNNAVYLNDWKTSPRAHVRLTNISKARFVPEAHEPNQGRRGSYAYPTNVKSSVWTYTGEVLAKTLDELAVLRTALDSAFTNYSDMGIMYALGEVAWFYTARVQQIDIADEQTRGSSFRMPYSRSFSLSLLLLDPRAYTVLPGTHAQSAGNKDCYNAGSTDAPAVFTLNGFAGGDLTGQNNTLGKTLTFKGLPAGNVVVDCLEQKCTVNGVDYSHKESVDSNWWDENVECLRGGTNIIGWTAPWGATWFNAAEA